MNAIQSYANSDSDSDTREDEQEKEPDSDGKWAGSETWSVMPSKPLTTNQEKFIQSLHVRTKKAASGPSSGQYGGFLHLHTPKTENPINANIYGDTLVKRQKQEHVHHCHQVRERKSNGSCRDERTGRVTVDTRRHPPPNHYSHQVHIGPCSSSNDEQYQSHSASQPIHSVSSLPIQGFRKLEGEVSTHHHKATGDGLTEQRLKRGIETSGLMPYIPKRLRTQQDDESRDIRRGSCEKVKVDIFAINEHIACQGARTKTSNKPPRQIQTTFRSHSGPVTSIQWNLAQYSHLLLSSSMDKTVKLWDYFSGKCVQTLRCHQGAVKDARWSLDGQSVLSCGFDKTARLSDAQSGTNFQVFDHPSYVTCARWNPADPRLFITGTYNSTIFCWDTRTGQKAHQYSGKLGQILAVEFINEGAEFVASCDTVSQDSADRTIMVWDTDSAALVSNQLYHEKYTCTSFKVHPTESVFMAQSNANYLALFSTKRPYRLNKYQRFEGHQIEGYSIGCDFSPDGSMVASGSADGKVYLYNYTTSAHIRALDAGRKGFCKMVSTAVVVFTTKRVHQRTLPYPRQRMTVVQWVISAADREEPM